MFGQDLFALAIFGVVLRFLGYLGLRLVKKIDSAFYSSLPLKH